MSIAPFSTFPLSAERIADLRSDNAGEHGAVAIYCGILAMSRDPAVRDFSREHLHTELRHRYFFRRWLPRQHQSRLLPVWWAAGWSLGALSALFGSRAVFRTIAAVETFVEQHYLEQIEKMHGESDLAPLRERLQAFCDDEVEHQQDAKNRLDGPSNGLSRAWIATVGLGSSLGVAIARRI